jgi:hypothetical protein
MINNISINTFQNKYVGKKVLIIGCGCSAANFIPLKEKLHNYFDIVIGCNKAFVEFDSVMDYHLVTEKTTKNNGYDLAQKLNDGNYSKEMPRFINRKGLDFYDENKYNIIPITRSNHGGIPDLCSYESMHDSKIDAGFFTGPIGSMNLSIGSVLLQAMHLSCIFGVKDIYLIGADMCFKGKWDHFYKDRYYRDFETIKEANRPKIVKIGGFETTNYFAESAIFIDQIIELINKTIGVNVSDFSDGLISKANKVDFNIFLK